MCVCKHFTFNLSLPHSCILPLPQRLDYSCVKIQSQHHTATRWPKISFTKILALESQTHN